MTVPADTSRDKKALRAQLRERLANLAPAAFAIGGERVVAPMLGFVARGPVALFASRATEIDTRALDVALLDAAIHRAAPRIEGPALSFKWLAERALHEEPVDALGIPTPSAILPDADLSACAVVVPGLGFDVRGGRLGYGRGYYDRALLGADLERCVGLCLDEQLVDAVPMDDRDVRLRWLCTPARGVFRTLV